MSVLPGRGSSSGRKLNSDGGPRQKNSRLLLGFILLVDPCEHPREQLSRLLPPNQGCCDGTDHTEASLSLEGRPCALMIKSYLVNEIV